MHSGVQNLFRHENLKPCLFPDPPFICISQEIGSFSPDIGTKNQKGISFVPLIFLCSKITGEEKAVLNH